MWHLTEMSVCVPVCCLATPTHSLILSHTHTQTHILRHRQVLTYKHIITPAHNNSHKHIQPPSPPPLTILSHTHNYRFRDDTKTAPTHIHINTHPVTHSQTVRKILILTDTHTHPITDRQLCRHREEVSKPKVCIPGNPGKVSVDIHARSVTEITILIHRPWCECLKGVTRC